MELQYYGANCIRLTTKKAAVTIDDNLKEVGLKPIAKAGDIVLFTGKAGESKEPKLMIAQPGEYEVSDISVQGIAARSHMSEDEKAYDATIFKIIADDMRVVIIGHIYPDLNDKQLEAIGATDVLIIPVGGNGYTLDPIGALKIIKKIEPKIVIPTHYADKNVKYEVPTQELEIAIKELAMEPKETVPKLKVKPAELTDTTQLVILERQ